MSSRRSLLAGALLAATGACRDSNIAPPASSDPEGGVIVFSSNRADNNFEIYRVGADGLGLRRLTTSRDAGDRAPVLSPDGRRIAWEREVATAGGDVTAVEIWTMNADGSDPRVAVRNGSFNRAPSWGPQGEIVYQSRVTGSDQIFRLAAGGAEPVRLTTGGAADQHPRVSPDGGRILFQSNRGLDFDIYVMDADGTDVRNLTSFTGDDRFAAWSPDGTTVVWTRFDESTMSFDLLSMPAAGGQPAVLVGTAFDELAPSISPDGRFVVYHSDRDPPFGLYIAPLSGGGEGRPLRSSDAASASSDLTPWWGPSNP